VSPWRISFAALARLSCATLWLLQAAGCSSELPPSPWEDAIRAFEAGDRAAPPAPGGIVFVGSSSIRLWKLSESFPDLPVINRGFGGSFISDSVRFAPRIVVPYKPRLVVFYAGDNDVAAGKSPETLLEDFKSFASSVLETLPSVRIIFISIKPSPSRWHLIETVRRANELIRAFTQTDSRLAFLDVVAPMLGADGKPRQELFVEDRLHMNAEGYRLWTSLLRPLIEPAH
jgi:lysophospholipase L1-like esterase